MCLSMLYEEQNYLLLAFTFSIILLLLLLCLFTSNIVCLCNVVKIILTIEQHHQWSNFQLLNGYLVGCESFERVSFNSFKSDALTLSLPELKNCLQLTKWGWCGDLSSNPVPKYHLHKNCVAELSCPSSSMWCEGSLYMPWGVFGIWC